MFGLLNFNAINRRLRLDFSDILGKGLSYDRVKGFSLATDGVYITREPLKLEGPSSNLELNGTPDLAHDRIDAKLLVTLPLTNNLTLAALIVGGPAVGGAVFVVDKLLGDRVSRFASVQYSVKGLAGSEDQLRQAIREAPLSGARCRDAAPVPRRGAFVREKPCPLP